MVKITGHFVQKKKIFLFLPNLHQIKLFGILVALCHQTNLEHCVTIEVCPTL